MDISARSELRHPVLASGRFGSGLVLVASAGISLALHLGIMASVPPGRGEPGAANGLGSDAIIAATLISTPQASAIEPSWTPPERLVPIASQLPRISKMTSMTTGAHIPPTFDESAYYRASQLTVRPSAAEYIAVPYPKEAAQGGTLRITLAIFIDEDGNVVRTEVRGQRLPAVFEDAALTEFGRARFNPGRIGDKAVKSRMLVEVEFAHEASEEAVSPRVVAIPGKR